MSSHGRSKEVPIDACNVLVSSCGRRGGLIGCFRQSLQARGIAGAVYGIDSSRDAPAFHLADRAWLVPRCTEPRFPDAVAELAQRHRIGLDDAFGRGGPVPRLAQRRERYGAAHIIEILRGSRSERVLSRNHDELSVYGIGKNQSLDQWRALTRTLLHQGLLSETQDGYPVLGLNAESWRVLKGERSVQVARAAPPASPAASRARL